MSGPYDNLGTFPHDKPLFNDPFPEHTAEWTVMTALRDAKKRPPTICPKCGSKLINAYSACDIVRRCVDCGKDWYTFYNKPYPELTAECKAREDAKMRQETATRLQEASSIIKGLTGWIYELKRCPQCGNDMLDEHDDDCHYRLGVEWLKAMDT